MSGIGPAMDTGLDAAATLAQDAATVAGDAPAAAAQPRAAMHASGTPAPVGAGAAPVVAPAPAADTPVASAATGAPATTQPIAAPMVAQPPARTTTATTLHPAPHAPALGQPQSTAGSLGGTVLALFLVIGLILALGWLAKRMPGMARGGGNNGLRLVASLPVGARERVVVVEVGGTQLLLGVGAGGTRTLHTLEQPLPADAAPATPQFAQLLAQHFGKKA